MPRVPMTNCGKNVTLKPTNTSTAPMRPELLVVHAAEHLRPPVVQAAEERDDRAAHHHVVEVRDDEVGVVQVDVDAHHAEEDAGEAADREHPAGTPARRASACPDGSSPLYRVATQLKTLIAVGIAIRKVIAQKIVPASTRLAAREHVVAPDQEAEDRDRDARERDELVAEDALAREHRDQLADHAEARHDHDVDGRVRVEPEEVLEQHRVAAERRVEDADAEDALDDQQQQRDAEHRRRQHLDQRGRVERPEEQRQPEPGHARRAQLVDRDDEVQAGEDRAEAEDERADRGRDHRGLGGGAVRRVERPAGVGRARSRARSACRARRAPTGRSSTRFSCGNATSLAPSWSGRTMLPSAAGMPGMMTRNTIIAPCSVNNWL